MTASRRAKVLARTPIAIWKSSPMWSKGTCSIETAQVNNMSSGPMKSRPCPPETESFTANSMPPIRTGSGAADLDPANVGRFKTLVSADRICTRREARAASPVGRAQATGSEPVTIINQDALFFAAEVVPGQRVVHALGGERHAWIQVVRGHVALNGDSMKEGDGAGISSEPELSILGIGPDGGEILLFDLP